MPRNSSGTYALPAGNPVVTNTLIQSTWANTTLSDVSTAMTDSLDRNGRGAMLAPLKNIDGTATAPSLSFSSEGTMGIYRAAAGTIGFAVGGALVLSLTAAGLTFTAPLVLPIGSAGAPSISFVSNTNTGLYSPGTNQVALSTNGVQRLSVDASGVLSIASGVVALGTVTNIIQASAGTGTLTLQTGGANNRVFIDSAGRTLVGNSITVANNLRVGQLLGVVTTGNVGGASFTTYNATSTATTIDLQHSNGTSDQSYTTIGAAGFGLGSIVFRGSNGTGFGDGALIAANSEAAWTGASQPSFLAFGTTPSGGTATTERLRITSAGVVQITGSLTTTNNITNTAPVNTTSQLTLTGSGAYSSIVSLGGSGGGSGQVQASGGSLVLGAPSGQTVFTQINGSNIVTVGANGMNVTGFLQAITGSSAAATNGNWSTQYLVVGPNAASGTGANFGVGYNTTLDQSEILSLAPGTAWKPMRLFASAFRFIETGSTTVLDVSSSGVITDGGGNELGWKDVPLNVQAGAYTLVIGDRGKTIFQTASNNVTVPPSVFSAGNVVTIVNSSAGATISVVAGAGVTLYKANSNSANASLVLAIRGTCSVLCVSSNVFFVSGAVT